MIMNHCLVFVWTMHLWKSLHSHSSNNYLHLKSNLAGWTVPTQAPGGGGGLLHPSQRDVKCDVTVRSGRRGLLHCLTAIRDARLRSGREFNCKPTRIHSPKLVCAYIKHASHSRIWKLDTLWRICEWCLPIHDGRMLSGCQGVAMR